MLNQEYAVGDYINPANTEHLGIMPNDRKSMVQIMGRLNEAEKWKDDVL